MYYSAGVSGLVHAVVVASALFSLPAIELAFGDRFGRGATRDVLTYGESSDFQAKFSSGALTDKAGETNEDETVGGIDPDDSADAQSSGDFGFDEPGDAPSPDTRAGAPGAFETPLEAAGGAGAGEDKETEAESEGEREDPGDKGDAEDPGKATREIVVFVDLRPEPEPDQEKVEPNQARAKGPTETPSPLASTTGGEAPTQVAALDQASDAPPADPVQSGDPAGLAEGETDKGRKSEGEATAAAGPNTGEPSPPDTPDKVESETEGTNPQDIPVAETASAAPTLATQSVQQAAVQSGTAETSSEATATQRATGQPGLPEHESTVTPEDAPLPSDIRPQPKLTEAVPSKGFEGLDTPAPLREEPRSVAKEEAEGASVAEIGGRLRGIDERLEGAKGIDNDAVEEEVLVASGNLEATRAAQAAQEARDGTPGAGIEEAEKSEAATESGTRVAAVQPGEDFRSPDKGESDRAAERAGADDPLAKVIAAIAGQDEQLARALSDPSPFDTIGGTPTPGDLKTNDILEKAADAGLAQAQTKLAKRYLLGLVDGREPERMIELLRNAAERGDQEAQLLLGALFADGRVVPQDLVQSHVFFELAAAQGSEEANEILPVIERQMAPVEVVDSKRLAREYRRLLNAVAQPQARGNLGEGLRDQLLDAAAAGNTAKIAELLSRGADLEGNDSAGRTAMINAAWRGREEVVDLLVELGADFNVTDYEGRTAISWAASNGHAGIVKKLLDAGARPNLSDNEGLTPLMRAAWNGEEDVVRTLIDHGASLSRTDGSGKSALDYAIQGGHREVARVLRAFGA